jgi:hypothetical protein
MTIVAILVAILLAFLAFKFIKGMIKFAVFAIIVVVGLYVAHQTGAF